MILTQITLTSFCPELSRALSTILSHHPVPKEVSQQTPALGFLRPFPHSCGWGFPSISRSSQYGFPRKDAKITLPAFWPTLCLWWQGRREGNVVEQPVTDNGRERLISSYSGVKPVSPGKLNRVWNASLMSFPMWKSSRAVSLGNQGGRRDGIYVSNLGCTIPIHGPCSSLLACSSCLSPGVPQLACHKCSVRPWRRLMLRPLKQKGTGKGGHSKLKKIFFSYSFLLRKGVFRFRRLQIVNLL